MMRVLALVIAVPATGYAVLRHKLSARAAVGVGGLIYIISATSILQG